MSLQSRIESLKDRHQAMEAKVFEEDHRPRPNSDELTRLKCQKLKLKDELERLAAKE